MVYKVKTTNISILSFRCVKILYKCKMLLRLAFYSSDLFPHLSPQFFMASFPIVQSMSLLTLLKSMKHQ